MKRFLTYIMLTIMILSMLEVSICYEEPLNDSIKEIYSRLVEAEKRGADVQDAALKLNKALELIRAAEENPDKSDILLSEARKLINEVNSSIPLLIERGEKEVFLRKVTIVSTISAVIASASLTYYYGPRLFWGIWLKLRSRWIVKVLGKYEKGARKSDR